MGRYLVGISAATVGTTASVYNIEGEKLGSGFVESVFYYPQPGSIMHRLCPAGAVLVNQPSNLPG